MSISLSLRPSWPIFRNRFLFPSPRLVAVGSSLLFSALASVAGAATQTWVGTTSDWGTASNWSGSVPVAGDIALFNTGTGLAVSLNGVNRSVTSIQFDSNAGSFSISPTASEGLLLSSGGNISILATVAGTNLTETISAGLTLGGNYTFTNARADAGTSLVISGNITNGATSLLTINGAGTGTGNLLSGNISNGGGVQSVTLAHTAGKWTVSGSNSYSGLTTVSGAGGTTVMAGSNSSNGATTLSSALLQLASASNGGLAGGTLTLTSGTLQAIDAARTLSNAVTLQAATVSGTQSITFNGKLTGLTGGGRTLTSSIASGGTLTLGDVDINTETANVRNFNLAGTGNTTIAGTIANGNGTTGNGVSITNTGTTILNGANTYTGSTTISAGTVILGGSNSGGGATTFSVGTLQLNSASNGGLASGLLTLTSGTLQAINAARSLSNAITVAAATVSGTQSINFDGKVTGLTGNNRTLTSSISGGGLLTLSDVDINAETANARTLTLNGSGNTTIAGTIANGNGTTANNLTISNTGTTTLNGANTYTGTTTISAGTVVLGGSNSGGGATSFSVGTLQLNSSVNGGLATGLLTLGSGTVQAINAARTLSNAVSLTGVTVSGTQSLTLNGKVTGLTGANRTLTSSIAGGTLTLADVDINTDTSASRNLTIAGTGNTTITGTIANGNGTTAGNLLISNSGTTTLSGANSYSGSTAITAGTVVLAGSNSGTGLTSMATTLLQLNSASNGGLASGTLLLGSGTLQAVNAARTVSNAATLTAVTVSGTQSLTFTGKLTSASGASRTLTSSIAGGTLTLGDVDINPDATTARTLTIAGPGNTAITGVIANGSAFANVLAITNTGTTTLSGTSTYTGATTLSAGRLNVTGALGATAVAVNAGATLGGNGVIGTTAGGSVTVVGGTNAAASGTIDLGDGSIGTLTIQSASGSNALTLGSAVANLSSVLNFETGTNSTDSIAVGNGAKMTLNLGGAMINLTALAGQTLANGTYNLLTYGAGSTFTGAFSLATTESGSTRYLLNNTSTAEQLIVATGAGSTAYWTGAQSTTWDTVSPGTNFSSDAAGTTPTGVPLSTTDVIFAATSGSNLTTTLGQNDFTINSLTFSGSSSASVGGTRTLTLQASGTNGITVLAGSGTQTLSTKITLGASQSWVNNSGVALQLNNAATTLGAGQALTLSGSGAGFAFITSNSLIGSGSLVINTNTSFGSAAATNSTYSGNIVLNSGTLILNGGSSGSSSTTMLGTGTLTINGGTIVGTGNIANGGGVIGLTGQIWNGDWTQNSTSKNLTLGGAISLGTAAGTTRTVTVGSSATFSSTGAISDGTTANSLTKAGAGTMRLYGASTFSGTTRIAAGALQIDANSGTTSLALQNSTVDLNALDTGVLQFGGTFGTATTAINSAVFGGLKGSRGLSLINTGTGTFASAVALTIGNNNSSQTYSGALSGAGGSVTKIGSGTQIFSGSNTYTGATTVSAGTLLINGSSVSATQVNAGTLGGTGTIANSVTVADGATVAPGSGGVGTLSTQDFTLSGPTSTLAMEISGTGAGAYDRLNVTGVVNLNGNGQITLSLLSYTPTAGDLLFLIVNDSTDAINGTLFGLAQGATFSAGGFDWQISYTGDSVGNTFTGGNDLVVMAAVPEPETWALVGCGAILLLVFKRRAERISRK